MSTQIIINDAPYGTEKAYNALRLAMALQAEHSDVEVRIFLLADAVGCALANQATPKGYYNIERMLKSVIRNGGKVKACGGCSEARGIADLSLIEGVEISTMRELAQWAVDATTSLSF
ncbi:DsrE family protein [Candidatus Sumerlaeota bacterium]|nr:DsrE family protein [Candidatus Sumerlaeota bacterium]